MGHGDDASFRPFTLALIQFGIVLNDKQANLSKARDKIFSAATKKPDLIVLPELFNAPYGQMDDYSEVIGYTPGKPYDALNSPSETVRMLARSARDTGTWLIGGSIPERVENKDIIHNTSTVYNPQGQLVVLYRKIHLFDVDIPGKIKFKESDIFHAGDELSVFDTGVARIGLGICYDIRFPEPAVIAARKGCQLLIYPAAFNTVTGPLYWKILQQVRALDNQVFVTMCSPARDMGAPYHAYGHTMVVDP
ncbi:hypothetical protein AX14_007538, partial [Amanita brunnescens Koide BX004]